MTKPHHVPDGWPALAPRITVPEPEKLVGFIKHVFGATGSYQPERPAELRIGESLLMISGTGGIEARSAFLYVYVEDTDATYRRALEAGATSVEDPRDLHYGDRRAVISDAWGNLWQLATHSGRFTP